MKSLLIAVPVLYSDITSHRIHSFLESLGNLSTKFSDYQTLFYVYGERSEIFVAPKDINQDKVQIVYSDEVLSITDVRRQIKHYLLEETNLDGLMYFDFEELPSLSGAGLNKLQNTESELMFFNDELSGFRTDMLKYSYWGRNLAEEVLQRVPGPHRYLQCSDAILWTWLGVMGVRNYPVFTWDFYQSINFDKSVSMRNSIPQLDEILDKLKRSIQIIKEDCCGEDYESLAKLSGLYHLALKEVVETEFWGLSDAFTKEIGGGENEPY